MTIKTIDYQLGLSGAPSQNFHLTAVAADGTMQLYRGNPGAPIGAALLNISATGGITLKGTPLMQVQKTSAQSVPSGAFTKIQHNVVTVDTSLGWNAGLFRYLPLVAGWYQVSHRCRVDVANLLDLTSAVFKNGTVVSQGGGASLATAVSTNQASAGSDLVYLNGSTDYIEHMVFQGNTGAAAGAIQVAAAHTIFSAVLVRPD